MDRNTLGILSNTVFKQINTIKKKSGFSNDDYLTNRDIVRNHVLDIVKKMNITYSSDDIETIAIKVQLLMSLSDDGESEDEYFEMDLFLGNLNDVENNIIELFSNWNTLLGRKDISNYEEEILSSFNNIMEEIYQRREELKEN